ncbi:hypothetical protein OG594_18240 [Streptomyces sp. NBC_01214]|uniref:hypothetical protein n=1 Tax=Streptomyces sp. NBC_01214 TaxID=2903777 RepID=UPI00225C240A|nr:hypothetical protein [Streptomyces sp. NBC_01214]MCX4803566.1 hypothetical protein [Streptomyces sp. NBC_01214]
MLWALLRHVSPAPGAERPGLTRVVLWDGHAPGTSVAYDLPWSTRTTPTSRGPAIEGTLRRLAAGPPPEPAVRDGPGIPVVDAGAEAVRFGEDPGYDRSDALHAAVSVLSPFSVPPESVPEPELLLGGFLVTGPDTVRLYVDRTDGPAVPAGPARPAGRPLGSAWTCPYWTSGDAYEGGCTALMAALPSLVRGELDQNASEAEDPYGAGVCDFTYW